MNQIQAKIISELHVQQTIDPEAEVKRRVNLLKQYLLHTKMNGYVLGISGGQDSTLTGKLCQLAVDELNAQFPNEKYMFIAMRLPYGEQFDEQDAQDALDFIKPTERVTVNIKQAVDASMSAFNQAIGEPLSDFNKGNNKARERMKAQYDVAAHYRCLVVGTDHAAEAITGFFTKFGDGACDITPIFGLNKRQGKQLLKHLQAPEHLYLKTPTADLEDEKPGIPDEAALGFSYETIDDYLEGKQIDESLARKIEAYYAKTEHKRQPPVTLYDMWWKNE